MIIIDNNRLGTRRKVWREDRVNETRTGRFWRTEEVRQT